MHCCSCAFRNIRTKQCSKSFGPASFSEKMPAFKICLVKTSGFPTGLADRFAPDVHHARDVGISLEVWIRRHRNCAIAVGREYTSFYCPIQIVFRRPRDTAWKAPCDSPQNWPSRAPFLGTFDLRCVLRRTEATILNKNGRRADKKEGSFRACARSFDYVEANVITLVSFTSLCHEPSLPIRKYAGMPLSM